MSAYDAGVGQTGFFERLSNISVFTGFKLTLHSSNSLPVTSIHVFTDRSD